MTNIPNVTYRALDEAYGKLNEKQEVYGNTTMQMVKGKWYVCITVPQRLRNYFSGHKQLKLSTGIAELENAVFLRVFKALELYDRLTIADRRDM